MFTEPLAAACEILEQVQIEPACEVAVLGDGKLGLLVAQTLLAQGARVSVFGRHSGEIEYCSASGRFGKQRRTGWTVFDCGGIDGICGRFEMCRGNCATA